MCSLNTGTHRRPPPVPPSRLSEPRHILMSVTPSPGGHGAAVCPEAAAGCTRPRTGLTPQRSHASLLPSVEFSETPIFLSQEPRERATTCKDRKRKSAKPTTSTPLSTSQFSPGRQKGLGDIRLSYGLTPAVLVPDHPTGKYGFRNTRKESDMMYMPLLKAGDTSGRNGG